MLRTRLQFSLAQLAILLALVLMVGVLTAVIGLLIVANRYPIGNVAYVPTSLSTAEEIVPTQAYPTPNDEASPEPSFMPSATAAPSPIFTESDVRDVICPSRKGGDSGPNYGITQSNGTITLFVQKIEPYSCMKSRLAMLVSTVNESSETVSVNPLNFTIIDFSGKTSNISSDTFAMGDYFDATTLVPAAYSSGWLKFYIGSTTPRYIVYNDGYSPVIQIDLLKELFRQ